MLKKVFLVLVLLIVAGPLAYVGYRVFLVPTQDPLRRVDQLVAAGDLRGAQLVLNNVLRDAPKRADAHLRMAQLQMQLGEPVAAELEYKAALTTGAAREAVLPGLAHAYSAQHHYKELLADIAPTGLGGDDLAELLLLRASAQIGLDDPGSARATLDAARKAVPGAAATAVIGARVALAGDDLDEAGRQIDAALRIDPVRLDALMMKERLLLTAGDEPGALAMAGRAVAVAPNSSVTRLDRANLLMLAGQDAKARDDVEAVRRLQPRDNGATYLSGILLLRAGKDIEAANEFARLDKVVQLFPRTLLFQSLIATRQGQAELAAELAHRYVVRLPADPDGLRLSARAEIAAQRPERALEMLQALNASGPADPATLDLLGSANMMLGRTTEATADFEKAAALAPDNAQIAAHVGLSQVRRDGAASAGALDRLVQLSPTQPSAGEALVVAALGTGDLVTAGTRLDQLRAQAGETEAVGILTGTLLLARIDLDGARTAFAATVARFPNSVNATLDLARVLSLQGRNSESEGLLTAMLAKNPANARALTAYVDLLTRRSLFPPAILAIEAARKAAPANRGFTAMLADVFVRLGDPRRAIALLQSVSRSEPLAPALMRVMARAQAAAGVPAEADTTYRELVRAAPDDLAARRAQVDALIATGQIEPAKAALREALATAPGNFGLMSGLVGLEGQTGGVDGALKAADTLRQAPANMPGAALLRGDALMRAKRFPDAVLAFRREYDASPTPLLALRLANASVWAGRDEDGIRTLADWLRRDPQDVDATDMLAKLEIKTRRNDDAQRHLEFVVEKRPNGPVAMNNLAWLYLGKGDERARGLAQRAFLQAPTPDTADTLGWIMLQQGDAKAAEPMLRQASVQLPDDRAVQYHWAVLLSRTGEPDRARRTLEPILSTPGDFEGRGDAQALLASLRPHR